VRPKSSSRKSRILLVDTGKIPISKAIISNIREHCIGGVYLICIVWEVYINVSKHRWEINMRKIHLLYCT